MSEPLPQDSGDETDTFGDLLAFHLFVHGTRPEGSPEETGRPWKLEDFANVVRSPLRTVRNWPKPDGIVPVDVASIQRALFGRNRKYKRWRERLADRHREGRSRSFRLSHDPALGITPPPLHGFCGRDPELQHLGSMFNEESSVPVVVHGLPGIGKTALAVEYVHKHGGRFASVWWCYAETRTRLVTSLFALALAQKLVSPREANFELGARAALQWVANHSQQWLLVYDNAVAPIAISDLFPSGRARLLITSRLRLWSTWARALPLEELALPAAVGLLCQIAKREDVVGAEALAIRLGRLPLALDHAANTCLDADLEFSEYLEKLNALLSTLPDNSRYPRHVFATFCLAVDHASPGTACNEIISYLAYCSPDQIPRTLAAGAIDDEERRDVAIAALHRVSLVKYGTLLDGARSLTVHRLVQTVGRIRCEREGNANAVRRRLLDKIVAILPSTFDDYSVWNTFDHLASHVAALWDETPHPVSDPTNWLLVLDTCGRYLTMRSAYGQAEPLLRSSLALSQEAFGSDHPSSQIALNSLAVLLWRSGDLSAAADLAQRAVELCEISEDVSDSAKALSLSTLGNVLIQSGDATAALTAFRKAFRVLDAEGTPDRLLAASIYNGLAVTTAIEGSLQEAEGLLTTAHGIRTKESGPDHPETMVIEHNIASILRKRGLLAEAKAKGQDVFERQSRVLGQDHPATLNSLELLGSLAHGQGQLDLAREHFTELLNRRRGLLPSYHYDLHTALIRLAEVETTLGDLTSAKPRYEEALKGAETIFGPRHETTASVVIRLARVEARLGHLAEAMLGFKRAIGILQDDNSALHATALEYRAELLQARNLNVEATRDYQDALEIRRRVQGAGHPDIATTLRALAHSKMASDDFHGVDGLLREALRIRERVYSEGHELILWLQLDLAHCCAHTGNLTGAKNILSETIKLTERTYGDEHPKTADALKTLAQVYMTEGATREPERLLTRCIHIYETAIGESSTDLATALYMLAQVFVVTRRWTSALKAAMRSLDIAQKTRRGELVPATAELAEMALRALGRSRELQELEQRVAAWYRSPDR